MRAGALAMVFAAGLMAAPLAAQDRAQTLADIKIELSALMAEFTSLKAELVATGGAQTGAAGGDALQRLDAIEAAIARLTAQAEAVEIKVNRVIADGSNRLGDLEFRLCEATDGCDPMTLGDTAPLGGDAGAIAAPAIEAGSGDSAPSSGGGAELAVGEKRDYDRAVALLEAGDFAGAAAGFSAFVQTYPGSPLTQEVQFKRGDALAVAGDVAGSARAYLDAFTADEAGEFAAEALLKLGTSLGALGQGADACLTLNEVGNRYPGSVQEGDAKTAMAGLGCS
ncbi:MAG: tol-pal system protein YbgF [Cypionkella sp.]|nr:tol-pal system protein YbgF [Cypionkella sp.]